MLAHALRYLRMGLSVIPLEVRGKKPLVPWVEFQSRKATEAEVIGWWTANPSANVGIVTGKLSNVAVVDLDGHEGIQNAAKLGLKSSIASTTGDGRHLWYTWTDGIKNSASKIAGGIDVRGEGGFVVAPPSVHPSGRRYRWLNQNFIVRRLPLLPESVAEFAGGNTKPDILPEVGNKEPDWIIEALADLRRGHVHNNLVSVLGKFRAHNFSEEATFEFLRPHCLENGKPFEGLRQKISEIFNRYEPVSNSVVPPMADGAEPETLDSFFETEEAVEWIIPGLVAAKTLGFVVGLPQTSKTWMLIDLAIEAARGGAWLGAFQTKQSRVWFIDQERFRGETKRRFQALFAAKGLKAADLPGLRINSGNTTFKLDLDQSFTAFRKRLELYRPELVIIDSLATFHTKEENNRKDIQEVLERIKQMRDAFGCTFLFIHHENKMSFQSKEEGKEPTLAEMAGNIAIPAAADSVITVRKRVDETSIVYHTKSTMSKSHKPFEVKVNDLGGPERIEVKGYL